MKVLIAGGTGFLGSALSRLLRSNGHEVRVLTRRRPRGPNEIQWDGRSINGWVSCLNDVDAIVNLAGYGLEHWPWTAGQKRRFIDSRVRPGAALAAGVRAAQHRPSVFLQQSGINYYGLRGKGVADENSPPADDFLAQLAVQWEAATRPVEELGVRRVIARTAVVLDAHGGLFPLMALPAKLGFGGPLGDGQQALPWIHLRDQVAALVFLLEHADAAGVFNLIAPEPTSNAAFMRAVARAAHRPYWFPAPTFLLRLALGEMSTLILDGRYSRPARLTELGFQFDFPTVDGAMDDLFHARAA